MPPRLEDLPAAVWKENLMPFMEFWEVYPALAANKSLVALRSLVSEFELNKAVADLEGFTLREGMHGIPTRRGFERYKVVATATAPRNVEALVIFGTMLAEGCSHPDVGRAASPALAARALHLALAYETSDDFPCHVFSDATAACDHARYRLALLHRDGLGVVQSCAIARGYLETVIERAPPFHGESKCLQVHMRIPFAMRALGELVRYSDDVTPAAARRALELVERATDAEHRRPIDDCIHGWYAIGLCHAALAAAGEDEDGNHAREAAIHFHSSCESGRTHLNRLRTDGPAAYELGRLFEQGIGVPQSRDGALLLFQVAANSGEDYFYRPMRSLSARLADNDAWMSQSRRSIETIARYHEMLSDALRLSYEAEYEYGDGGVEFGPSDLAEVRALDGDTGGAASCIVAMFFSEEDWTP